MAIIMLNIFESSFRFSMFINNNEIIIFCFDHWLKKILLSKLKKNNIKVNFCFELKQR